MSEQQDQARGNKTERRAQLDGGLDQRAGLFTSPDRALALQNFRFNERGSITKRRGGSLLVTLNYNNGVALPAPVLVQKVGAGSLAAGTYVIKYTVGTVLGTKIGVSTSASIAVNLNDAIQVQIPPINSGDTIGQTSAGADDPFHGGFINDGTTSNFELYAARNLDTISKQASFTGFLWSASDLAQEFTLTSYASGGAAAPSQSNPVPIRSIFYFPTADVSLVFAAERGFVMNGTYGSATTVAAGLDKNGNGLFFSRLPTRIDNTILGDIPVVTDGVGKPKKLHIPTKTGFSSWQWRQVGANLPPTPSQGNNGAGVLNGTFKYVVTFTYRMTRFDGTTYDVESNASASVTATPANNTVRITNTNTNESGLVSWSVYRTVASGTSFFLVSAAAQNIGIGTTTFDDNVADASLILTVTPPLPLTANDHSTPPSGLRFITSHASVLFGVKTTPQLDGSNRILRVIPTSTVVYSLFDGTIGGSIDCWPLTNSVNCDNSSPITGLKSFRGLLYVFKNDEIGVIEGDSNGNFAYRKIWGNHGSMENGIVEADDCLYCFDNARTVLRITGLSVQDLGYEAIQSGYFVPFATSSAIGFREGGGRPGIAGGGMVPLHGRYDPTQSEVRWVMSDFVVDFTISAAASYTPSFYEYVMNILPDRSVRFSVFTGASSGGVTDRRIGSSCAAVLSTAIYQARFPLYVDYHGRVVADDQVEGDLNNTVAITVFARWPIFFGDNPEMVKRFAYMYVMLLAGSNVADALTFSTQSLAKTQGAGVPKQLAVVNGGSTETRTVQMLVADTVDTANTLERGLQLILSGTAISGPLSIRELSLKYTDVSDLRAGQT